MKVHPMLFNGDMVRAILSGTKTQTRRVMKVQPPSALHQLATCVDTTGQKSKVGKHHWINVDGINVKHSDDVYFTCPYGYKGDQIWVRETWGVVSHTLNGNGEIEDWEPDRTATPVYEMPFGRGYYSGHVIYRADGEFEWAGEDGDEEGKSCWKPAIHIPRAASRILLEITDIRVERLNDCSDSDALSEGISKFEYRGETYYRDYSLTDDDAACSPALSDPIESYKSLWNSINGAGSWDANPWVWVIEFKVVKHG